MAKVINIIGNRYGRLLVVDRAEHRTKCGHILWKCLCDCQTQVPEDEIKWVYATKGNLERGASDKRGGTSSCGCYKNEITSKYGKANKKQNKYDLSNEYGIGYTFKGYEFYFDLEDYELIKDYCWHEHNDGYLRTCYETYIDEHGKRHNKYIMLHQLLGQKHNMYDADNKEEIDHINGLPYDNRKDNLRRATHMKNMKNVKLSILNTSGYKGVHYAKNEKKWKAYITCDNKRISLGTYKNKEDAIKARLEAEKEYYAEFNRGA